MSDNLLGMPGVGGTRLPDDPAAARLDADHDAADHEVADPEAVDPAVVAAAYPASSLAWAVLAERALAHGDPVAGLSLIHI